MFFGIIMIKNILEGRFLMTDRNKDTNATASAFGWDFQYNLALYLVMDQDLRQVEKFKVEGSTEDIEIYFRNKEPIYIQAKSQENPHSKSTTTQHLTNAINSLINAVSKVNEEYSEVIYGNNIEIPIRANKKNNLFEGNRVKRRYKNLPDGHRKKIDSIIDKSEVIFDKNKLKEKLFILKVEFSEDDDETRYRFIKEKVINCLNGIGLKGYKANRIFAYLQNEFKNNASKRVDLTIQEFGWLIILYSINIEENNVYEIFDIPQISEERLKTDFSELIFKKSLDFELITSVISEYNRFSISCTTRRDTEIIFINEYYSKYRDDILSLEDVIPNDFLDDLTKVILFQILSSYSDINSVKKGLSI